MCEIKTKSMNHEKWCISFCYHLTWHHYNLWPSRKEILNRRGKGIKSSVIWGARGRKISTTRGDSGSTKKEVNWKQGSWMEGRGERRAYPVEGLKHQQIKENVSGWRHEEENGELLRKGWGSRAWGNTTQPAMKACWEVARWGTIKQKIVEKSLQPSLAI